jgi:hypothetical protein
MTIRDEVIPLLRVPTHASGSGMRHHDGKAYARKNQQAGESQRDGIDDHAMPILIVAFRVLVFREVWDRRAIRLGITDQCLAPMSSARSTQWRPELDDTAGIVVRLDAIGKHDEAGP